MSALADLLTLVTLLGGYVVVGIVVSVTAMAAWLRWRG